MQPLDIYISAHTDWCTPYPANAYYKIVTGKGTKLSPKLKIIYDESPLLPLQHAYNEGTRMHHVWKNCELKDYVGFVQYRKYFSFFSNVPYMDKLFTKKDVVLPHPIKVKSIYRHYEHCHCIQDLLDLGDSISSIAPDYIPYWEPMLKSSLMYIGNMFIMRRQDFIDYCNFVFPVLSDFDSRHGFTTDDDVTAYITANYANYKHCPNNNISYQSRLQGFLLERLTNVFIMHHFHSPMHFHIDIYNLPSPLQVHNLHPRSVK